MQSTIASKINVTPISVCLPISELHLILKKCAAVNCSFSDNLTPLGGNIYFAGDGTCQRLLQRTQRNCLRTFLPGNAGVFGWRHSLRARVSIASDTLGVTSRRPWSGYLNPPSPRTTYRTPPMGAIWMVAGARTNSSNRLTNQSTEKNLCNWGGILLAM